MRFPHIYFLILTGLLFLSCSSSSNQALIKVNVEGLRGELILQNNNDEKLTIDKDGEYEFKVDASLVDEYSIENIEEPCEQRCTVADATGELQKGQTIEAKVTCISKEWNIPSKLSDKINAEHGGLIDAKMDKRGDVIVIYDQYGSTNILYMREFRNGKWKEAERLSFTDFDVQEAHLAMSGNGEAVVIWSQNIGNGGSNYKLLMAEYRDGVWRKPASLADAITPPDYNYMGPTAAINVVMNDNGDALISWNASTLDKIFKSEYRDRKWTHPQSMDDSIDVGGNDINTVLSAISNNGEMIIAWNQLVGANNRIFKSEYYNNQWHYPVSTSDYLDTAELSNINMDNEGRANLVYTLSNSDYRLYKISRNSNHQWETAPGSNDNFNFDENETIYKPRLASDQNGDALLVWSENGTFYRADYENGIWDFPTSSFYVNDDVNTLEASKDDQGNAMIIWVDFLNASGDHRKFYMQEKRNGVWKSAKLHFDGTSNMWPSYNKNVVDSNNCRGIFAWSATETEFASDKNIFVSMYR